MTVRGIAAVVRVEWAKLAGQVRTGLILAACVLSPFIFAAIIALQSSLPEDTLFGRSARDSGFALALVVLGFSALWALPVLSSIVGGDAFSSEDRYGTWATVLTRSRSRSEVFAGKVTAALTFCIASVVLLGASSLAAGMLVVGAQPLVSLSGIVLSPQDALLRVVVSWVSVLPAATAVTALALLLSAATRNSAAGIGLPVLAAMALQLAAFVDGPEPVRRLLITTSFNAWHGVLADPGFYGPVAHGAIVSSVYLVVCLALAYRILQRRDIGG